MELNYFCRNDNQLCCAACICKIKNKEDGQHADCEVCEINQIKEEKKSNLKKNIIISIYTNFRRLFKINRYINR